MGGAYHTSRSILIGDTMKVYLIKNTVNGKQYIGQTSKTLSQRWGKHKNQARHGRNCALATAIEKYGAEKFTIELLHVCENKEEMDFVEMFYIALFNTKAPTGYNLTDGGEKVFDCTGRKLSFVHAAALLKSNVGRKHPPRSAEWVEKQRLSKVGKTHTEEHKKKIGASINKAYLEGRMLNQSGNKDSEETRAKKSEGQHVRRHVNLGVVKEDCRWCQKSL